ncbi:MAG TPA: helix-turn-helix transcriptional regulator [Verrucomicrobiae bacterium]|nr:helix-turn-helix transcriptional regulator [Verrucomicrobiae bacterium]
MREFRLTLKLGQPDFAAELGIPRGRLAAFEYLKAPIRFDVGYRLCERFQLSLLWLAKGEGQQHLFTPISPVKRAEIGPRELFSTAYDKLLSGYVEERLREWGKHLEGVEGGKAVLVIDNRRLGVPFAQSQFEQAHDLAKEAASKMPDEKKKHFALKLGDLAFAYWPWEKECKPMVDTSARGGNLAAVNADVPTWKQLVLKVKAMTRAAGAKAALAAELKTSRQNVNKWLSGEGAPSAELTLSLFRWVKRNEGK